jgi:hypothetical protein
MVESTKDFSGIELSGLYNEESRQMMNLRSNGSDPRLEVWYFTMTDEKTKIGCWFHVEAVTKTDGEIYIDYWLAVFYPDKAPGYYKSGPVACKIFEIEGKRYLGTKDQYHNEIISMPQLRLWSEGVSGSVGECEFKFNWTDVTKPLYTFPKWAWEKELLPAAQVLPGPAARIEGEVIIKTKHLKLAGRGGLARIYGHGSAENWAWLHADLPNNAVLEIVLAKPRNKALSKLGYAGIVRLRYLNRDFPKDSIASAVLFKGKPDLPNWAIRGTVGRTRLSVMVEIPRDKSVEVPYVDPDSSKAYCVNSAVATASIILEKRKSKWQTVETWNLIGSAHAEVGYRKE